MSISDQGSDSPAWVCRWSSGFCSASNPEIHILAGEKVCIQAIKPMQSSSLLASSIIRRMPSAEVRTGFQTTEKPISFAASRASAICRDWFCTWLTTSGP